MHTYYMRAYFSSSIAEIRHDREDAPVVLRAAREIELAEDVGDVGLDRALAQVQALGYPHVGAALGHQREHLALARGERRESLLRAQQPADDLGVERRATAGHARQRIEEVVHVEHAVLQQVT